MKTLLHSGKLRLSAILMMLAIIGIAAFQCYWFTNLYSEEWKVLKRETDLSLKDVLYRIQVQHLRKDLALVKRIVPDDLVVNAMGSSRMDGPRHMSISITTNERRDSPVTVDVRHDSVKQIAFIQNVFFTAADSSLPFVLRYPNDTTSFPSIGQLDTLYRKDLLKSKIGVPYTIQQIVGTEQELRKPMAPDELKKVIIVSGSTKTYGYLFEFDSPTGYILNRLKWQLVMGVCLVAFTTASFIFLYRNLRQQQQLAEIKNEFISNMTHELKTPISTVKVAVEALRHFDALNDPQRTREYLDISALELQRLAMLVDKVLKLSSFENKEIELNKSNFDLYELVAEVVASMKLQMEKAGAFVQLTKEGDDFLIKADRTHMSSVISNLLDNALKYGKDQPAIALHLSRVGEMINVVVSDNGIGIPAAYIGRIFEKFFRVPTGDHHNIKGYGLGLSYVHHIITRHKGAISVESKEGKGSTFTIKLPVT